MLCKRLSSMSNEQGGCYGLVDRES